MALPTTAKAGREEIQRSLDNDDMLEALKQLQSRSEDIFGKEPADGTHWPDSGCSPVDIVRPDP